jgi:hypothetical protein
MPAGTDPAYIIKIKSGMNFNELSQFENLF